jgi:hypothetical protein
MEDSVFVPFCLDKKDLGTILKDCESALKDVGLFDVFHGCSNKSDDVELFLK